MSQLLGGGAIETFCPACGFGMRQSPTRPTRPPRSRWFLLDAKRTFAPPGDDAPARPGFRLTSRNLFALVAWALFVVAVRAQFVGYPSLEPVLFAELYVIAFAFVMFWLMFARTAKSVSDRQLLLLFIGAVAGVVLVVTVVRVLKVLPVAWEPDYCGDMTAGSRGGADFRLPPKTFRCTRLPIGIAGWFLGWWLTHWLMTRWERAGGQAEAS